MCLSSEKYSLSSRLLSGSIVGRNSDDGSKRVMFAVSLSILRFMAIILKRYSKFLHLWTKNLSAADKKLNLVLKI